MNQGDKERNRTRGPCKVPTPKINKVKKLGKFIVEK